jgi:hypothetical protein
VHSITDKSNRPTTTNSEFCEKLQADHNSQLLGS